MQALLVRGLESPLVAYSLPPHTIKTSVYLALFLERDDGFLPYCLKSTKDVELPLTFDLGNLSPNAKVGSREKRLC